MALGLSPAAPTSPLQRTQEALQKSFSQLSSLRRIGRASDDGAALAISETLRAAERSLAQGERGFSDGISLARTAESGLGEIGEQLGRLRELSVQAGNSILGDTERHALQAEADAITAEITRVSESTQFNGQKLLNGDAQGAGAVTLRDGSASDDVVQVSIDDSGAAALGLDGFDVSDPASLEQVDQAMRQVSSTRSDLGAFSNRLESGIRNLQTQRENTAAANSRLVDADVAKATAELARSQILQQMQVSAQSQANIAAGTALFLLR